MKRGTIAAALAACALPAVADAATAAAPRAGARYDGESATGLRIWMQVGRDGARLTRYWFATRYRCSDGRRRALGYDEDRVPAVTIDSAGNFANEPRWQRARGTRRGVARMSVSGSFGGSGDVVTGTIEARFRSRRFTCASGPVAFTAHLDGSAGAPFRDATLATGRYTARGRGARLALRMFTPARELRRATMRWSASCRRYVLRGTDVYRLWPLTGASLTMSGRRRRDAGNGLISRERSRLTLRFTQRSGYVVDVTWRLTAGLYRGGRRVDSCATGVRRFSGAFRGGPENLP